MLRTGYSYLISLLHGHGSVRIGSLNIPAAVQGKRICCKYASLIRTKPYTTRKKAIFSTRLQVMLYQISICEAEVYVVNETAMAQPSPNHYLRMSNQLSNRDPDGKDHGMGQH